MPSADLISPVLASTIRGKIRLLFPPGLHAHQFRRFFSGSGRLIKEDGLWGFDLSASPRSYRLVRHYFASIKVPVLFDEAGLAILAYGDSTSQGAVDFRANFLRDEYQPPDIPRTKEDPPPWDHQKRAFWFAVDRLGGLHEHARGGALLGLDMGCGKTRVAIDLICNYNWWRVLVVCPQKVVAVWPHQWNIHSTRKARVLPLLGPIKRRIEDLQQATKFQNVPLLAVTNYEAFDRSAMQKAVKAMGIDALILDEGHRLKAPGGKRSKWFGFFADEVPVKVELTGTKEPNSVLDIFGQARILDRGYFGSRFSDFRSEYAITAPIPGTGTQVMVVGYKNQVDLAKRNFQFCIEVAAEEVQDLPDEHHVDVPVVLEKKTRAQYDSFEEEYVLELEGEDVTAHNVLVKLGKLQEITGGFIRNPETQKLFQLGTEKVEALKEKLADLPPGEPVVVFYRMTPDAVNIALVCDQLDRPHFECSGQVNELDAWQKASGGEVLICQISAGKEGVDLTRSRWAFYFSLGYGPGEFLQSKKRQHRPGQKSDRVTYFHLVATGTVDEKIYEAISTKQDLIDQVKSLARKEGL